MRSRLKAMLVLLLFMVAALGVEVRYGAEEASATATTLSVPNVDPQDVFAHGDGSVSVTTDYCPFTNNDPSSTANSAVTMTSSGATTNTVKKITDGWQTQPCNYHIATGLDGTSYIVQAKPSNGTTQPFRIIATRDDVVLWTKIFFGCSSHYAQIHSLVMGPNNTLYANIKTVCPTTHEALVAIDAATGQTEFTTTLPGTSTAYDSTYTPTVMPYSGGIAVLSSNAVYYYGYDGASLASATTFTPVLNGGSIKDIRHVTETGRVFIATSKYLPGGTYEYHLYYKDPADTTIQEVTFSGSLGQIFTTPSNGVVAQIGFGFNYFDSTGAQVYQASLASEPGASIQWGTGFSMVVDDDGNVIVRRVANYSGGTNDAHVIVDSFSPTGTVTRLFSSSSLGGPGHDAYYSSTPLWQAIGGGKLYMVLCHTTTGGLSTCSSNNSPVVLSIDVDSSYDYPRAWTYTELEANTVEYVALGDSYSSGEGVPDFLPPSDSNDCHRSEQAYPVQLPQLVGSLRLAAFRACSGATTDDIRAGGAEPPQLDSLSGNTDIVTITAGGNDVDFREFAEECVIGTCDSASSQYQNTTSLIDNYLPTVLDELYEDIRSEAPNADIYVVGYPDLSPEESVSCAFLSNGEKVAISTVAVELNTTIQQAVSSAGAGFYFVDAQDEFSPFWGHEVCTEEPYFNGVSNPIVYSFHPNALGQEVYAALVEANLQ